MTYPTYQPADFRRISYERRDESAQPRVLMLGLGTSGSDFVIFHVAGDDSERIGTITDVARDNDLVGGMEPRCAFNLGINWDRLMKRRTDEKYGTPDPEADAAAKA